MNQYERIFKSNNVEISVHSNIADRKFERMLFEIVISDFSYVFIEMPIKENISLLLRIAVIFSGRIVGYAN